MKSSDNWKHKYTNGKCPHCGQEIRGEYVRYDKTENSKLGNLDESKEPVRQSTTQQQKDDFRLDNAWVVDSWTVD